MEYINQTEYNSLVFREQKNRPRYRELERMLLGLEIGDMIVVDREDLFKNNKPFKKCGQCISGFISSQGIKHFTKYSLKTLLDGWVITRIQ